MNRFLLILSLLSCLNGWSQTTTISPFSRISIGDVDGAVYSQNFAMGRLSNALSGPLNLNPYNPSSYSELVWTNFEVGVMSKNYWLSAQDQSQSANKTHFNHLAIGVPITEWWGASFGMMPISQVGYDYRVASTLVSDTNTVPYENAFLGSGGLNRVYLGHGFNIKKKIYFGFNFAYHFGDLQYEEIIAFTEADNYLNTGALSRSQVGDIYLDFGFQYKLELNKEWNMNLGFVFIPTQGLNATRSDFTFTYSGEAGNSRIIDTVSYNDNASFSIILPPKYGFGVLLSRKSRIKAGVDVDYTMWSASNYNTGSGLNDVLNMRFGGEYINKENRYKIRAGFRYGKMPLVIDGTEIDDIAISAGLAFPFKSKDKLNITELNIGAEFGQRGKNQEGLFLEQYINVHIGLTLNNKWFIKRKFD